MYTVERKVSITQKFDELIDDLIKYRDVDTIVEDLKILKKKWEKTL